MKGTILIIDDEEPLRRLLSRIIGLEGFATLEAPSLKSAWKELEKQPDVVLCDVKLPDGNGVDFVRSARASFPLTEFILLTAYGNIPDGVQAIKNGAFDYITKGNDNDRIIPLVHQAIKKATTGRKAAIQVRDKASTHFEDIGGTSPLIKQAVELARKIAPTEAAVLLLGETGTGKEVFANAIHAASKRAEHPFVAVNCSAFPRDLLESELFGHKAGAFTNASRDKKGLLEVADHGTLFLDEIGEMNIELQAKLLRVLESGTFIKLGDDKITRVNIRILAATHRNLQEAIEKGQFREDLFYRLNVFALTLPPLRERKEDIAILAAHFLETLGRREGKDHLSLSPEALGLLSHHNWPGNIRELRNVMERLVVLADQERIEADLLPYELQREAGGNRRGSLSLADVEKNHILRVLQHTGGNKTRAAEFLGIGLTTLYRKLIEYQIDK